MRQAGLLEEIGALKHRLSAKDRDTAMLQREIGALNAASAALQAENARLTHELALKVEEMGRACTEIARLKGAANKDSGNSSKPPSRDGFKRVPNSREKSGRRRGGQKGHPGHRLGLPENIGELVEKGGIKKKVVDHTGGTSG